MNSWDYRPRVHGHAVVLGGSGGLGAEIVRALAAYGADPITIGYGRNAQAAPALVQELAAAGTKARAMPFERSDWTGSPGAGRASTGPCSRLRWCKRRSGPTRPVGGKAGSKRHLLVGGRGVPLSPVVTAANAHDVTQLETVLAAIMVKRPCPKHRRGKHLCADAAYRGHPARAVIEAHGYIPHVVGRRKEAEIKQRDPKKKARRWVVEVCHSWFNRFPKLLVRYEKLERSFLALNQLASAIIAFRKIKVTVNIIYG